MMSLHWELLPRKLRDVIAPETVAMVTEVTGRKGVVISQMAGNAPINGNKEDAFIYVFLFQGGLVPIPFLIQCAQFGFSLGLCDSAHLFLSLNVAVNIKAQ